MKFELKLKRILEEYEDGYVVAEYASNDLPVIAAGYNLPLLENVLYETIGFFRPDDLYGRVYQPSWHDEILPDETDRDQCIAYLLTLRSSDEKKVETLHALYKSEILTRMRDPENFFNLIHEKENDPAFDPKPYADMFSDFARRTYAKKEFILLDRAEVKPLNALSVLRAYQEETLVILKNDPYRLVRPDLLSFQEADLIALSLELPADSPGRIRAAIREVLRNLSDGSGVFSDTSYPDRVFVKLARDRDLLLAAKYGRYEGYIGSTELPVRILYLLVMKLLKTYLPFPAFTSILATDEDVFISHGPEGARVYATEYAVAEYRAAKNIKRLLSYSDKVDNPYRIIDLAESCIGLKVSVEQKSAIVKALTNSVSVITGGPGTGKTTVQKVLIDAFRFISSDPVTLLAPTGEAAKRMGSQAGLPASTIHRAIGLRYDGTMKDQTPLAKGLYLVDEASMIDAILLDRLLMKIPTGSKLVFIGDIDQLPSVGAGTVLKSLIESPLPVGRLTQVRRQKSDSNIASDAARIRNGNSDLIYGDDVKFIEVEGSEEIAECAAALYKDLSKKYGLSNVACLTAFKRSTETGSQRLNERIRCKILPDEAFQIGIRIGDTTIYVGDRILFTANLNGLVNGDIGTVQEIKGKNLIASFDGELHTIKQEYHRYVELAYALTIHKSQGSEFKQVILICDPAHERMNTRSLCYTGFTRAREGLTLIGSKNAFREAVSRTGSRKRESRLSTLLTENTL